MLVGSIQLRILHDFYAAQDVPAVCSEETVSGQTAPNSPFATLGAAKRPQGEAELCATPQGRPAGRRSHLSPVLSLQSQRLCHPEAGDTQLKKQPQGAREGTGTQEPESSISTCPRHKQPMLSSGGVTWSEATGSTRGPCSLRALQLPAPAPRMQQLLPH